MIDWNNFEALSPLNLTFKAFTFEGYNIDFKDMKKISVKKSPNFITWDAKITLKPVLKGSVREVYFL